MGQIQSPPYRSAIVASVYDQAKATKLPGTALHEDWVQFFNALETRLAAIPVVLGSVHLVGQVAAVLATPFVMPALADGLYRVSYYARTTVAGGVSGSFQVTFGYTDGATSQTHVGALKNGNTIQTHEEDSFLLHVDQNAPLTYAVAYTSAGVPVMTFQFDAVIEQVVLL